VFETVSSYTMGDYLEDEEVESASRPLINFGDNVNQ
jgi:hypothetical protein